MYIRDLTNDEGVDVNCCCCCCYVVCENQAMYNHLVAVAQW